MVRRCHIKTHEIAVFCGEDPDWPGGILLDRRSLHNHLVYSNFAFWRLLSSSVATQWYKVSLYRMQTQEVTVLSGGSLSSYSGGILLDG